jgi:hypothetical protein
MTSLLPFATTLKYSELAENVPLLPHFSVIPVISTTPRITVVEPVIKVVKIEKPTVETSERYV